MKYQVTGNTGHNQLPMKQRAENVLKVIDKRGGGIYRHYVESRVADYMIKKGLVVVTSTERGSNTSISYLKRAVPLEKVEEEVREPYKKRKAAMAESKKPKKEKVTVEHLIVDTQEYYVEFGCDVAVLSAKPGGLATIKQGVYKINRIMQQINSQLKDNASRIWGVKDDGTVFWVKQRKTNPRSIFLNKQEQKEFLWIKLQAKEYISAVS